MVDSYDTYMLRLSKDRPQYEYKQGISQIVTYIKDKELVVLPTETVYGLAADATSNEACKKIFKAKKRPQQNPLIVHCSDISMGLRYFSYNKKYSQYQKCSFYAEQILRRFSPGPITVIVYANDKTSCIGRADGDTVAIRIPNNIVFRDVIKAFGFPLVAPSANTSGRPSPTSAEHAYEEMKGSVRVVVDGGECEIGVESTIIDCTCKRWDVPCVVRVGSIRPSDIAQGINCQVATYTQFIKDKEKNIGITEETVPGGTFRHYIPLCKIYPFFKGRVDHLIRHLKKNSLLNNNDKSLLITVSTDIKHFDNYKWESAVKYTSWNELAQKLYALFFNAERDNIDSIFIECPSPLDHPALHDRICTSSSIQ